jgi:hypothetical protein
MGFLKTFKSKPEGLLKLPTGSFTVDRDGRLIVSTLPSSFPKELTLDIARRVMKAFDSARTAQLPLTELVVDYPALRLTARELRGGAIIFLAPHAPASQPLN